MTAIPKVKIRLSDSYKAAITEITKNIDEFRKMDDLYDVYMVETYVRNFCLTNNEELPDDYPFDLDLESLYINLSSLPTLQNCKGPVISMLEYAFTFSPLKLWVYTTQDDKNIVFVQVPLSHLTENANHY